MELPMPHRKPRNNNREEKRVFACLKQGLDAALKTSSKKPPSVVIQCGADAFECDDVYLCNNNQERSDFVFLLRGEKVRYISHKASNDKFSWNGYGSLWRKCWPEGKKVVVPANSKAMLWTREWCIKHCYERKDPGGLLNWAAPCPEGIWFVPEPDLQRAIVYGPKYGTKEMGPDNVHFLAIGEPKFEDKGKGTWTLDFPEGTYPNGVIPTGPNTPIVVVKSYGDTKLKRRAKSKTPLTHKFYTEDSTPKGMNADFGYFPLRLLGPPVLKKGLGCIQVEYPSGKVL